MQSEKTRGRAPKVLMVSAHYAPEITGNAPYVASLARGLSERGHEVSVLTTQPHYPEWRFRQGYTDWTSTAIEGAVVVTRVRHWIPRSIVGIGRVLLEIGAGLRFTLRKWPAADVVLLVSPALFASSLVAMRLRMRPARRRPFVVVWVQDLYSRGLAQTGEGTGAVTKAVTWVESWLLRSAGCVVMIHDRFKQYAVDSLGVLPGNVAVIRNWTHLAETPTDDVPATRRSLGWSDSDVIVLHAGNQGVKQGLENVVAAAEAADREGVSVRFVLLGDGNQHATLVDRARGVQRIAFLKSLADAEYRAALRAADILLVNEAPGVRDMAVPSKLTSYFDAGRPVLAATEADSITAEELLTSGAGLVVPPAAPEALLKSALELASDPEMSRRLGSSGRRHRESQLGEAAAISRFAELLGSVGSSPDGGQL